MVDAQVHGDEIRLRVRGPLGASDMEEFQSQLSRAAEGPYRHVVLDLSDLDSINSRGIGKILLSHKRLSEQGRDMCIRGCSRNLYNVFRLIKLNTVIPLES